MAFAHEVLIAVVEAGGVENFREDAGLRPKTA